MFCMLFQPIPLTTILQDLHDPAWFGRSLRWYFLGGDIVGFAVYSDLS